MLMRTDPFRDLDRLTEAMFGTTGRPAVMPMDAYRQGDTFHIDLDLPGVDPDSIDVTVEQNVLTVHAERRPAINEEAERVVRERTFGTFSRQVFLGETLDVERLSAGYEAGVLTIKLPVAEQAKPRKISVGGSSGHRQIAGLTFGAAAGQVESGRLLAVRRASRRPDFVVLGRPRRAQSGPLEPRRCPEGHDVRPERSGSAWLATASVNGQQCSRRGRGIEAHRA